MNFAKFLRTPFLTEHLRWLLLSKIKTICFQMLIRIEKNAKIICGKKKYKKNVFLLLNVLSAFKSPLLHILNHWNMDWENELMPWLIVGSFFFVSIFKCEKCITIISDRSNISNCKNVLFKSLELRRAYEVWFTFTWKVDLNVTNSSEVVHLKRCHTVRPNIYDSSFQYRKHGTYIN